MDFFASFLRHWTSNLFFLVFIIEKCLNEHVFGQSCWVNWISSLLDSILLIHLFLEINRGEVRVP